MPWVYLFVAGLFEVVWATGLPLTEGFTKPLASAVVIAANIASIALLAAAARHIPIGTAYGVWVGIGAVGTAIGARFVHGEPLSTASLFWLGVVTVGVIGLERSAHLTPSPT